MNEQNTMPPFDETTSLHNTIIDEIRQKISDAITGAETTSKEKYIGKQKLIESANDMNTQEKLDAMDKNYNRRNQERWQNVLCFAVISFSIAGLAIGSPAALKNVRRLRECKIFCVNRLDQPQNIQLE